MHFNLEFPKLHAYFISFNSSECSEFSCGHNRNNQLVSCVHTLYRNKRAAVPVDTVRQWDGKGCVGHSSSATLRGNQKLSQLLSCRQLQQHSEMTESAHNDRTQLDLDLNMAGWMTVASAGTLGIKVCWESTAPLVMWYTLDWGKKKPWIRQIYLTWVWHSTPLSSTADVKPPYIQSSKLLPSTETHDNVLTFLGRCMWH